MIYGKYKGRKVPLNKPIRTKKGKKKFKVYVMNPKTKKIVTVRFGERGMKIKKYIPKRKKSYCSRSAGIKITKPKELSPNYWSRKMWSCNNV